MNLSMCNKYITRVTTELSRLAVTPELCSKLAGGESQENGDGSCWGHAGSQGNPYVFSSKWPDLWEFGDVRKKYIGGWWKITCILFIQDIYIYTHLIHIYIYLYNTCIYIIHIHIKHDTLRTTMDDRCHRIWVYISWPPWLFTLAVCAPWPLVNGWEWCIFSGNAWKHQNFMWKKNKSSQRCKKHILAHLNSLNLVGFGHFGDTQLSSYFYPFAWSVGLGIWPGQPQHGSYSAKSRSWRDVRILKSWEEQHLSTTKNTGRSWMRWCHKHPC